MEEEKDFFEVFDTKGCKYYPPYNYSALEKWIKIAPIYRPCTIAAEMITYLAILFIAFCATVVLLTKSYRKAVELRELQRSVPTIKETYCSDLSSASSVAVVDIAAHPKFASTAVKGSEAPKNDVIHLSVANNNAEADNGAETNNNAEANNDAEAKNNADETGRLFRMLKLLATENPAKRAASPRTSASAEFLHSNVDETSGGVSDEVSNVNDNAGVMKANTKVGGASGLWFFRRMRGQRDENLAIMDAESPGRRFFHQLTVAVVAIPLLAYVFLLFVLGLAVIPPVIKSIALAPLEHYCHRQGFQNVVKYKPAAFKVEHSPYDLAITKLERNETGYLAHLKCTMLYTYGKSGSVSYHLNNITKYAYHGIEVYAWDLPGYGFSSGPRTPKDFVDAAKVVVDSVSRKSGKPVADILLSGHSMGGAIAAMTATQVKTKKLILHNPLDALSNCVIDGCKMTGYFSGPLGFRDFLDARPAHEDFARSGGCLLILAGRQDEYIAYQRHRDTFLRFYENSATQCGTMVVENDFGHESDPWDSIMFANALRKFLTVP